MDRIKLLAVALGLSLASAAHAQGGWYAGLDVGDAKSDARIDEHIFIGDTTARATGSSTGFRMRGGYRFGRFFAIELSYVDFGEVESHFDPDDCPGGAPGPCPLDVRTSMSGFLGNLVGTLPMGEHWYLDARLGIGTIEVETRNLATGGGVEKTDPGSFHYGLGGGYRFNDHWEIRLDYGEYNQADTGLTLAGDFGVYNLGETSMTSAGVSYRW